MYYSIRDAVRTQVKWPLIRGGCYKRDSTVVSFITS